MSERLPASWRDGVSTRLGEIQQGLKDLGRNFDAFKKTFDGNGQPGRCELAKQAREVLESRIRALAELSQLRG